MSKQDEPTHRWLLLRRPGTLRFIGRDPNYVPDHRSGRDSDGKLHWSSNFDPRVHAPMLVLLPGINRVSVADMTAFGVDPSMYAHLDVLSEAEVMSFDRYTTATLLRVSIHAPSLEAWRDGTTKPEVRTMIEERLAKIAAARAGKRETDRERERRETAFDEISGDAPEPEYIDMGTI